MDPFNVSSPSPSDKVDDAIAALCDAGMGICIRLTRNPAGGWITDVRGATREHPLAASMLDRLEGRL